MIRLIAAVCISCVQAVLATALLAADPPTPLSAEQQQRYQAELEDLERELSAASVLNSPRFADAAVYAKGVRWALMYDREYSMSDVKLLERALLQCRERLTEISQLKTAAVHGSGRQILGYRSTVDGSVQPYGLIVPHEYDPDTPMRLDVVLHGSSRPVGMSELRFMSRFERPDEEARSEKDASGDQPWIELHPLGRVENCYRWSGETDVFEAIEDVCRRYNIDRERIVLRGMSMGASGTWHLGLKHPDRFVALGPYCGYVDTHRFSETPVPGFVKVGPLPAYQEQGLHLLDSVDYAANAGIVPAIACMGEKDVFFQAHVLMKQALMNEGLPMTNLISPDTGHIIDPVTHAEQLRLIREHVTAAPRHPKSLRFVTWSLKYHQCHWIDILELDQHYVRSEISAELRDGVLTVREPVNISRFGIVIDKLPTVPQSLTVGLSAFDWLSLQPHRQNVDQTGDQIVMHRRGMEWVPVERQSPQESDSSLVLHKKPGIQGPIDDAFCSKFVCVRGTGKPWNESVQRYADASLKRFAGEWHQYFRGELPVKDDVDVTPEDLRTGHLILFGDPGSNSWIHQLLPKLPFGWTPETLNWKGKTFGASDHVPAVILPNTLVDKADHYVVLNSGHTFRGADLSLFNYLLYPRWGDWALLQPVSADTDGISSSGESQAAHSGASSAVLETVLEAGYFNERWQFPTPSSSP